MSLFIKKGFESNFQQILKDENFKDKQLLSSFLSTKKPNYETTLKYFEIHNSYFGEYDYNEIFDWRYINGYENINGNSEFKGGFGFLELTRRINKKGNTLTQRDIIIIVIVISIIIAIFSYYLYNLYKTYSYLLIK